MEFLKSIFGNRSKSEVQEDADNISRRLNVPDFKALESEFGSVCQPLRSLYANTKEILREHATRIPRPDVKEDEYIYVCWYHPVDQKSIDDRWPANSNYFEFGNDGSGNTYVVNPTLEDPEILFYDHESNTHQTTGVRLSQYLGLPEAASS
jgi:hypothetical protein